MRSWALASILVLVGCGGGPPPKVEIGAICPDFTLKSLDGERFEKKSFSGKPFVLSFWATWCQPCLGEIPVLEELDAAGEIQVVTIALDEQGESKVRPFVREQEIDYLVLLGDEATFARFNGFAIPYTLVLDGDHRIVNLYRGPITEKSIQADLASMAGS